jgi:hypothetical protein
MNKRIAKLYDQSIIIEDGGDYVCGELNPVKFAELIIRESIEVMMKNDYHGEWLGEKVKEHFGVER